MKTIGKILGTLIYGGLVNYLIWLFFYWITPHIMNAPTWVIVTIAVMALVFSFAFLLVVSLFSMLLFPIKSLTASCKPAAYACIFLAIGFLVNGYDAMMMPWQGGGEYSTRMYVAGGELCVFVLLTYISLIYTLVSVAFSRKE